MNSGATLTIDVAAIGTQNEEPPFGLTMLVPLVKTNLDLTSGPENGDDIASGLGRARLGEILKTAFTKDRSEFRSHWHSDTSRMLKDILGLLPGKMVIILATGDVQLYASQLGFGETLVTQFGHYTSRRMLAYTVMVTRGCKTGV